MGGATTKLNATQSATLVRAPAKICQNLPRNAGNASRRHCRDGPDRVDQDCQGFHVRDAARSTAPGPPPSLCHTRRPVVARRRSGGASRAAGGARRPRSLVRVGTAVPAHDRTEEPQEHTSELQSLMRTSYAVFCLKQK